MKLKFLQIPFLMVFLAIGVSCSESEEPVESSLIVGTWTMTGIEYESTSKITMMGEVFESTSSGIGSDIDLVQTIAASPNVITSSGGYTINAQMDFMGQTMEHVLVVEDFLDNSSWELDGDRLILTMENGERREAVIKTLTANELVYEHTAVESSAYSGVENETTVFGRFSFVR